MHGPLRVCVGSPVGLGTPARAAAGKGMIIFYSQALQSCPATASVSPAAAQVARSCAARAAGRGWPPEATRGPAFFAPWPLPTPSQAGCARETWPATKPLGGATGLSMRGAHVRKF